MRSFSYIGAMVIAAATALTSTPAHATILSGTFTLVGLEDVRVGATTVNWGEVGNDFSTDIGDILFPTGTLSFDAFDGTTGTIRDLDAATEPTGVPISFDNFITANAEPTWNFVLTFIAPGSSADSTCDNVEGTVCTPLGSPFTITNTAAGATVSVGFAGYVTDGSGDPVSPWTATFTVPATDRAGVILSQIVGAPGFYQTSSAGTFTVTAGEIPEPATYGMMGAGLLALGMIARRRKMSA